MRGKRAIQCAAAALPPIAAIVLLVGGGSEPTRAVRGPASTRASAPSTAVADATDLGPVVVAHASVQHEAFAPEALADRKADEARAATDARTLEAALAEADRDGVDVRGLQDLGRLLTRLLTERPELGLAAADALAKLTRRPVLFQLERALRAVADEPGVHARLLALVADAPSDAAREAAIGTLGGRQDPEALAAFAPVLADAGAGPLARSAAAYELAKELDLAPEGARASAVASARAVVADPTADGRVRTEAWGVLGAKGLDDADRERARAVIAQPDADMDLALAAARALLSSGEPRARVARALASRAKDEPVLAAALEQLAGNGAETR